MAIVLRAGNYFVHGRKEYSVTAAKDGSTEHAILVRIRLILNLNNVIVTVFV